MPNYARIEIMGHLGRDPEVKETTSGSVTEFSVAVTRKTKTEETTTWYKVSAWKKLGEVCQQYLAKGSAVFVAGTPVVRAYINKEGKPVAEVGIQASEMQMLGGKAPTEKRDVAKPAPGGSGFEDMTDDIAF